MMNLIAAQPFHYNQTRYVSPAFGMGLLDASMDNATAGRWLEENLNTITNLTDSIQTGDKALPGSGDGAFLAKFAPEEYVMESRFEDAYRELSDGELKETLTALAHILEATDKGLIGTTQGRSVQINSDQSAAIASVVNNFLSLVQDPAFQRAWINAIDAAHSVLYEGRTLTKDTSNWVVNRLSK